MAENLTARIGRILSGSVNMLVDAVEDMAPEMARSVVAAEDANFCLHWGFDIRAIRAASGLSRF